MKVKRILRFYFSAGSLNRALDNLILALACGSRTGERVCDYYFDKVERILALKGRLCIFYREIDGVIKTMSERDYTSLKEYARLRTGINNLDAASSRELHRAVVKFSRRAERKLLKMGEEYRMVCRCYALINSEPD